MVIRGLKIGKNEFAVLGNFKDFILLEICIQRFRPDIYWGLMSFLGQNRQVGILHCQIQ